MEPRKHLYIDGLRGIAILMVMLVHNLYLGSGAAFFSPTVFQILDDGQFGVQLFFMVSAYTLMASFYTRTNEPFKTRNFFIRRFFRIAPMYYLAILYFTFQSFIGFSAFTTGHAANHLPLGRLLANLLFLNGFNPYWINNYVPGGWSIGVEMTFYLVLPLLCRWVKSVNGAVLLLAASVCLRIFLEGLLHTTFLNTNEYLYYYFPNQLPVFSLGILAFFVVRDGLAQVSLRAVAVLASLILLLNYSEVGRHFTISLGMFLVIILLAKKPHRLVANRVFAAVGKVSFSMYLVHFAIMHWLVVLGWNELFPATNASSAALNLACRYGLLFFFSFLVSWLCYRLIEVPFQRQGKLLIQRLNKLDVWLPLGKKPAPSSALPFTDSTKP